MQTCRSRRRFLTDGSCTEPQLVGYGHTLRPKGKTDGELSIARCFASVVAGYTVNGCAVSSRAGFDQAGLTERFSRP